MASPGFKNHNGKNVSVTFAGIIMAGFGEDEFVSVVMESDAFEDVVGADGEVVRIFNADARATVNITLMSTSDSNDKLSSLHNLDIASPNGAGVGALFIRDNNGRAVFRAQKAWIAKAPDASLGKKHTQREWKLRAAELVSFHGGN